MRNCASIRRRGLAFTVGGAFANALRSVESVSHTALFTAFRCALRDTHQVRVGLFRCDSRPNPMEGKNGGTKKKAAAPSYISALRGSYFYAIRLFFSLTLLLHCKHSARGYCNFVLYCMRQQTNYLPITIMNSLCISGLVLEYRFLCVLPHKCSCGRATVRSELRL